MVRQGAQRAGLVLGVVRVSPSLHNPAAHAIAGHPGLAAQVINELTAQLHGKNPGWPPALLSAARGLSAAVGALDEEPGTPEHRVSGGVSRPAGPGADAGLEATDRVRARVSAGQLEARQREQHAEPDEQGEQGEKLVVNAPAGEDCGEDKHLAFWEDIAQKDLAKLRKNLAKRIEHQPEDRGD